MTPWRLDLRDELYIDFGRCPKCGEDEPRIHYMPAVRETPAYFQVTCRRCDYEWFARTNGKAFIK